MRRYWNTTFAFTFGRTSDFLRRLMLWPVGWVPTSWSWPVSSFPRSSTGACMKRPGEGLARIPARESVLLFARHLGQEKLWQQVFLGFFGLFLRLLLDRRHHKKSPPDIPGWWLGWLLVAFFLANSVLALQVLRMLPTTAGKNKSDGAGEKGRRSELLDTFSDCLLTPFPTPLSDPSAIAKPSEQRDDRVDDRRSRRLDDGQSHPASCFHLHGLGNCRGPKLRQTTHANRRMLLGR